MEYVIGTVKRGSKFYINLKTKDIEHTNFKGRITLEDKRGNTVIRDTFTVIEKYYQSESPDGYAYDWYFIEGHSRQEDRSEEIRSQMEQLLTDLEIESIQQEQFITDNEIAIMELQLKV
jgi:hypothetical protein